MTSDDEQPSVERTADAPEAVSDYPAAARSIALNLSEFCREELPYQDMIADAARSARSELARLTEENATLLDWDAIAKYVETVARQAFRRGFQSAETFKDHRTPDDGLCELEADIYVASGFDAETVKQFHPGAPRSEPTP